MNSESTPIGMRKGCWTEEEDILLRKCIEKYGEGKWHQIPQKAGLNRCRKSCRLRWLNYLNPNIKRGGFTSDEVDLMKKLHKLLGNRWSLIAGRLPQRTANDVKNYWNTHLRNKSVAREEPATIEAHKSTEIKAIRPKPRRFSNNLTWFSGNSTAIADINTTKSAGESSFNTNIQSASRIDDEIPWWDNMVVDSEFFQSMGVLDIDQELITSFRTEEVATGVDASGHSSVQDNRNISLGDFLVDDMEHWNLYN